jgi:hypothetical protein
MWTPPQGDTRFPKGTQLTKESVELMKQWRDKDTVSRGRLGELALRIAVITASANHDEEVNTECMQRALEFMEWQEQIRSRYKAGVGVDEDARCTETILTALAEEHAKGAEWVRFTRLCQNKNWYKKFSATRVSRVRIALASEGVLIEEYSERDKDDPESRAKRTGLVQLAKDLGGA